MNSYNFKYSYISYSFDVRPFSLSLSVSLPLFVCC